jgi:uncharacterized protein YdeI (YjbR/CyaY-like superfamily)
VDVTHFETPEELRAWLEAHHDTVTELWVGFYKKATGRPSITYPQALDEALCYGWIDGVRRSVDAESYTTRFTPRRRGSNWSAVNVRRVGELTALGRMRPSGLRAFETRDPSKANSYSSENLAVDFDAELAAQFRANAAAWDFFTAQPPGYRRTATWWVMSAKREDTRRKRLATLIDDSAHGRRLANLTSPSRRK